MSTPDFTHIRTHTIRDKSFRLIWRKPRNSCPDPNKHDVGQCDHPESPGKELWIWPKQDAIDLLATVFHECTHGVLPDLDENAVVAIERGAMRLLERMGIEVRFNPRRKRKSIYERTSETVEAKAKAAKTRKKKQARVPRKAKRGPAKA